MSRAAVVLLISKMSVRCVTIPDVLSSCLFLDDTLGEELTLDWLRDDSEPDEFFLATSLSFLSFALNIFFQDWLRLTLQPSPS